MAFTVSSSCLHNYHAQGNVPFRPTGNSCNRWRPRRCEGHGSYRGENHWQSLWLVAVMRAKALSERSSSSTTTFIGVSGFCFRWSRKVSLTFAFVSWPGPSHDSCTGNLNCRVPVAGDIWTVVLPSRLSTEVMAISSSNAMIALGDTVYRSLGVYTS